MIFVIGFTYHSNSGRGAWSGTMPRSICESGQALKQSSGASFRVQDLSCSGLTTEGSRAGGLMILSMGLGFRVKGTGFRVQGLAAPHTVC